MAGDRTKGGTVVLVDDDPAVLEAMRETLVLEGHQVRAHGEPLAALCGLDARFAGVVISDLRMPEMDGLELMARVHGIDPAIPVILVTGHGDVPRAVEAMRSGAFDFLEKPADPDYLIALTANALRLRALELDNRRLRGEREAGHEISGILIGISRAMALLRDEVLAVAAADVDTLIHGETGTGKELVARCLHRFSPRGQGPFVAINCGALPETLIASELFGHEAGAFTGALKRRIGRFEHASGGTLFLDEIESMPLHLQTQLLRALQERAIERVGSNEPVPIDVKVVAATKVDLREAADAGSFREDLFYRLNMAEIRIPPLRRRAEDIPILFRHFVGEAAAARRRDCPAIAPAVMAGLIGERWRGNVRELRNRAERLALGLGSRPAQERAQEGADGEAGAGASLPERLDRFEEAVIREAIEAASGNLSAAARRLGIPRKKLYLRMERHGIALPERGAAE